MQVLVDLPLQEQLEKFLDNEDICFAKRFWSSLWANYVRNKGSTSLPYWMEQMGDAKKFNGLLYTLREWIISTVIPARNWAEVQLNESKLLGYFDEETLTNYRKTNKYSKYVPAFEESYTPTQVRVNGEITETGIVRDGFSKAAMTQYYYDTTVLNKHLEGVIVNTVKGMCKMRERYDFPVDDASYDVVAAEIVTGLAKKPTMFTQGGNVSDSRGRAIKASLSKVANPIGYKDFRALIVIPSA